MNKIKDFIISKDIDAIFISNPKNIFYLTGFDCDPHERLLTLVIDKNSNYFMLVPELEKDRAIKSVLGINIVGYLDTENGYEKLKNICSNYSKIGVEKEHLTVKRYEDIKDIFKIDKFIDISFLIRDFRKYKNENEINNMKEAARLADMCIDIAKKNIKEGISELELKFIIENEIKKEGVTKMAFDTIVLFGDNAANPHGESSNRRLKLNEYVLIDLGCYYNGYASDITRCIPFGNVSDFDKMIYNLVLKANNKAIESVKPGMSFSQIDKIARDVIEKEGYGKYFNHRLGHGIGIDCHEFPDVSQKTNDILEEGMTFTIEPGIYIPNRVGIRIEDDILVTKNGYEVLTKYEK